ncbi:hypothetical protein [Symbiopectobacterium sp. RP]
MAVIIFKSVGYILQSVPSMLDTHRYQPVATRASPNSDKSE